MELMTIQETAAILKVSPVTVRRYITARRLPAVRVGKGVRIRREDVENLPTPIEAQINIGRRTKLFTKDDSLWNLVALVDKKVLSDVSKNKYKNLAEAYSDLHKQK